MDASKYYHSKLKDYNNSADDLRSPDDFSIDCMIGFANLMNGQIVTPPKPKDTLTESQVFVLIISKHGWWRNVFKGKQHASQWKKRFEKGTVNDYTVTKLFAKFGFHRIETFESSWVKR